jgi:hypothetical protein
MTEVQLDANQIDLILTVVISIAACIAFCLGWLAHEFGGK